MRRTRKTLSRAERELSKIEQRGEEGVGVSDEKVLIGVDPFMLPMPEEARAKITETVSKEDSPIHHFETKAEAREAGVRPGSTIGWDPREDDGASP